MNVRGPVIPPPQGHGGQFFSTPDSNGGGGAGGLLWCMAELPVSLPFGHK